ncbi:MAG TPA: carboxypeptidase-like regulatory domain-containing protein, partial [Thermoanaerobaculia bacterium]|nr:carboxypeptidase-like regulatory domain-containing protein [Thermoanaerobaculia bacterium]
MISSVRRFAQSLLLFSVAALPAAAAEISSASLQIQGVGLKVITVSATTGLDIPASIQTEFGGKQNDEAPVVEGLLAVGELSGPGIETPIRIETAPGHKFRIPGLSREGVYFLQNIRLTKDGEFLQNATPAVATITVSNLLQTSVRVRQLTPEELRARGITIDARNYEVYEYTFTFLIDGQIVEIPFPVIVDPRTHEVRPIPKEDPYQLPPVQQVLPPRWQPPDILTFELGPGGDLPQEQPPDSGGGGGGGRPSIPAALVIPNSMAVLHQFFAVTLMVSNGAPAGSEVVLDSVSATIKPPAPLRTVKSIPTVAFGQPVPIVDAATGVTFLVAQARGEAEWTMEGLQPGTHTVEVEVRATYKSPGQNDFPMKGTARATVVVHDPRFHINFSHPDTVREGIDYTTYSFITNMSPAEQHIRVTSGLPECINSPGANVCRVEGTPEFHELSIPAGEMRTIEYKLRPGVTGSVFATAGTVSDEALTAAVQLHMGVSESGIPLSPATLVMPYYARFMNEPMVAANLQLFGLGYSLATAPLVPALAKHPNVIKSDVFHRAVDIARAGQRVFLGEPMSDALAHMALDLLGNANELREWDELRRNEKSGRKAAAAISRQLEAHSASQSAFVERFAAATAWREPYLLATTSAGHLALRNVATNAQAAVPSEAESGWIRTLPFAEVTNFRSGKLAMAGRWSDDYELVITPSEDGPIALDLIFPAANPASVIRAHADVTGTNGQPLTVRVTRGATAIEVRNAQGGIAAVATLTPVAPEAVRILGARQDLYLDPNGHKVSLLWNRPVSLAPGDDLLAKLAAQVVLNRDGVSYTGNRPMSAAAMQDGGRVANVTFDHALSQNATYTMTVAPLVDPLSGGTVSFNGPLVPVIDNNAPGGIIFGHVLKGDNSPVAGAEVRLWLEKGAPQYDLSRASDGAFLFEFVPRDIDNGIDGAYELEAVATDGKSTSVNGAVRLPGRVHFVNLVFLGRGSAEGYVRYDNGDPVPSARVVVGSTMFDQFRTTSADANGRYSIGDLPVGPLTFSASDADGNVTFAATEIKTPGQVLQKDLSIYRRPFPGVATIRGVVKRSDTNAVVAGARVGVYSQGYGLIDGTTDSSGRFEFRKVPSGFVTVLAAEWNVSREATALDFDLAADETRDLTLTLNVKPDVALVAVEGDVIRENPLYPGDASKYEKVAGAIVKIENAQAVTADANGRYVFPSVPVSFAGKKITAYDPSTTRSATAVMPQLDPSRTNIVPLFISTANGYGTGTIRVRVLSASGLPVSGYRVIVPGFPPEGPTPLTEKSGGVYELKDVAVGATMDIWAVGSGSAPYGDQTVSGRAKVEFNGHVAALTLRLPGQGLVRVKLAADIDLIGDVTLVYPAWDEAEQAMSPKTRTASTAENGQAGFATFSAVPALQNFTVSSAHPVYGYASASTKLGFDGDVATITLQLNKLSTVSGVIYAVDGRTPIPGAAVRIEDGRQNPGIFTSRPDGSFEFKNVAAGVGFRVIAEITQDGVYRTGVASGTTPALGGPVRNVAVVMRTQGSIEGRIVYAGYKVYDPQNSANNVVDNTPGDLTDNAPVPLANFALRELDFPQRNFGIIGDWITADIAGRFRINNVFTGPLRITAADPGNQEIRGTWTGTLSLEGEQLTAYVGIGATGFGPVSVRVVDPNAQNAAVANAEVTLIRGNDIFDLASTDGNGIARFAEVPVGSYRVIAYSKALGKSGASVSFSVVNITGASVEVVLEFSGKVDGKLIDPEAANRGIPGAQVTLTMTAFQTRASTDVAGVFLFEGVREGTFRLEAKDTLTNRRASATRNLTQADPNPYVTLELEPTETLHVSVYYPNDTGGNSNVLVPIVNIDVRQRNNDFYRALQGNSFAMQGLLENERYSIKVDEVGGDQRTLSHSGNFPQGSASNPLKLVLPAFGGVEVRVLQSGQAAANAKVTVSGGGRSAVVYTDAAGVAVARGIPLGAAFVQVVSQDGAFSGSASTTIASQS